MARPILGVFPALFRIPVLFIDYYSRFFTFCHERQGEVKASGTIRAGIGPDLATMVFDDLPADGKPQTCSAGPVFSLAALGKFIEDGGEFSLRNLYPAGADGGPQHYSIG